MIIEEKILQSVFQDNKPRTFLTVSHFGDIIFKEANEQGEVYKILQIYISDDNSVRKYEICFELHILADNENDYLHFIKKTSFGRRFRSDFYEEIMLRHDLYDILERHKGKKHNEFYLADQYHYANDDYNVLEHFHALSKNDFYAKVLTDCVFNEKTLSNLVEIDHIDEKPLLHIQKLYWGYGENRTEKLYECINLQNLSVWNEFGDYLNENIIKLQSLSKLSIQNMYSIPKVFLQNIHTLPYLVSLRLSSHPANVLDHEFQLKKLPLKLHTLENLKYLDLDGNKLINFSEICKLTNLKTLSLSKNQFKNLAGIGSLQALEVLNLSNNNITELPVELEKLSALKILNLTKNPLKEIPDWLCELTQLEELHLEQTQLQTLPENIDQLSGLKILSVRKNPFLKLPKVMAKFPKRTLDLELRNLALFDKKAKQKLEQYPKEEYLFESDFNFKLLVIQKLMYEDEVLLPKFDIWDFARTHNIDIETKGYNVIPEAALFFKKMKISSELLIDIEELKPDGGDEVYAQIIPFWDGEDDSFTIKSIDDIKYLPRLKRTNSLFFKKEHVKQLRKHKIKVSNY